EFQRLIGRRRAQEFDRVLSGDGAWWFVSAGLLHQVPRRRPVAMTVEQRADDAAVEHSVISLVLRARLPLSDDLIAVREAANVQTFWVCRATAEASEIGRECFLNAAVHFLNCCRSLNRWIFPVAV